MKTQPLISILLPVFNVGHYLADCLDSIAKSSYTNWEIIAIDDFSKDDSWKILKVYKQLDKRIRVYRNVKHYGKALTLNRAVRKAKGQCIAFLDAKDMVYKHRLTKQVQYLLDNPKVPAVATQCTFINSNRKIIQKSDFPITTEHIYQRPLHGISLDFETLMLNRLVLPKDVLYFHPNASLLYSDVIIKLLQYGDIINLPFFLQYRRAENPNRQTNFQKIPSIIKLWVKSIDAYDYRPSLRSFFSSFLKLPNISAR